MIGIFDSGYGGLSVFKEIEKVLPNYDYIYLGDNARAPYGDLSQELIYDYSRQAVDFLFAQGCELIIFACNTASAMALRRLQQEYLPVKYPGKNVLGVIRPMVEAVLELGSKKVVAIMGTKSTVDSGAYINEFANLDKNIKVVQEACPLLVPLIEASKEQEPQTKEIVKEHAQNLQQYNPEVVVLGCTHYGWLRGEIKSNFSSKTIVLESGQVVAKKLFEYLQRHSHYAQISDNPRRVFLTSGNNKKFDSAAKKFLGKEIKSQTIILA